MNVNRNGKIVCMYDGVKIRQGKNNSLYSGWLWAESRSCYAISVVTQ